MRHIGVIVKIFGKNECYIEPAILKAHQEFFKKFRDLRVS